MTDAERLVSDFYRKALTVNAETRPTAVLEACLAADFVSRNLGGTKDRAALSAQLEGFWALIPDLDWAPQQIVQAGDTVVVRSVASGRPNGAFMGLTLDGSRRFRIDTIDIHSLRDGRIASVYHLEDWASAIAQLRAN